MKKTLPLLLILLFTGCTTLIESNQNEDNASYTVSEDLEITDSYLNQREVISENVLLEADPYYSDFASHILDLIVNKNWEEIYNYSESNIYKSYIHQYKLTMEDYCMFILNTGTEGSTTNHSLNSIYRAYYTKTYSDNNRTVFQGIYLYKTGETEQFKVILKETETDLVITRE